MDEISIHTKTLKAYVNKEEINREINQILQEKIIQPASTPKWIVSKKEDMEISSRLQKTQREYY